MPSPLDSNNIKLHRNTDVPAEHVRSTQRQCQMTDVVDIYTKQTAVTEFLTADGSSPTEIHSCLRSTRGGDDGGGGGGGGGGDDDDAIDVSSDTESIILKAVKRTLVTGAAAANKPQQQ